MKYVYGILGTLIVVSAVVSFICGITWSLRTDMIYHVGLMAFDSFIILCAIMIILFGWEIILRKV